jgi:hypothetical protein
MDNRYRALREDAGMACGSGIDSERGNERREENSTFPLRAGERRRAETKRNETKQTDKTRGQAIERRDRM